MNGNGIDRWSEPPVECDGGRAGSQLDKYVKAARLGGPVSVGGSCIAALIADDGVGGKLITVAAVVLAVAAIGASVSLYARRLRLRALMGAAAIASVSPFAIGALAMLAIVGDIPEVAGLARRYWAIYPLTVAATLLASLGSARTSARSRVKAMMAALPHRPREAAEAILLPPGFRRFDPDRGGALGVLGSSLGGVVAGIVGRGSYFWALSVMAVGLTAWFALFAVFRQWYAAAALQGRDRTVELAPRDRP